MLSRTCLQGTHPPSPRQSRLLCRRPRFSRWGGRQRDAMKLVLPVDCCDPSASFLGTCKHSCWRAGPLVPQPSGTGTDTQRRFFKALLPLRPQPHPGAAATTFDVRQGVQDFSPESSAGQPERRVSTGRGFQNHHRSSLHRARVAGWHQTSGAASGRSWVQVAWAKRDSVLPAHV